MRISVRSLLCVASACSLLCACSATFDATLMARDSGRTYSGSLSGSNGAGYMTVTIGERTFTGPAVRVASTDALSVDSATGFDNHGGTVTVTGTSYTVGDVYIKALMSSPDSHGLRCNLVGRISRGGGVCLDDAGKAYDVILVRRQ